MENVNSLKKDIVLIILGAVISGTTAFVTSAISEARQDKKANIQKKLELNDQISKDLGKRLYLTYKLYKSLREKDTSYSNELEAYEQSKEEWNIKGFSYQSLLRHYYSDKIRAEFFDSVYNPLVALGQEAEYKKFDKDFKNKWAVQQKRNVEFISKIYNLADE